jgi:hypothetical protein
MSDTIDGVRIVDMPDLGAVNNACSFVGEHAGSGLFKATALQSYLLGASRYIFVRQYGALGDGSTDDTAAINAAFAAVPSAGGVVVFDPGLTYKTTAHLALLRSNTVIQGNGAVILTSHATDDILQLGSAGATQTQVVVKDLKLWASVVKTGGACVRAMGVLQNSDFENVQFGSQELWTSAGSSHRLWNGLDLTAGFYRVLVDGASEAVVANHGVRASGTASVNAAELQLNHRTLYATWGVYIGGSANVYMNGEISVCTEGVHIDKAITSTANREIFFQSGAVIDGCTDYCLHVVANSAAVIDAHGTWFSSAGRVTAGQGVGVYFEANATPYCNALFSGVRLFNCVTAGMNNAGATVLLSASMISQNASGVILNGVGAQGSTIQANLFTLNTGAAIQLQGGITVYAIGSNNFYANGSSIGGAPIFATTSSVRDNLGYQTANSGEAVVPAGANPSVAVTHGLVGVPASVTLGDTAPSVTAIGVTAVTATTFTIGASGTLAGPVGVYWRADMGTNS